jgi:hypothetical protein
MGHQNLDHFIHLKSSLRDIHCLILIRRSLMTTNKLKTELWIGSYGISKFFGNYQTWATWCAHGSISFVPSPSSYIQGEGSSTVQSNKVTRSLSNTQAREEIWCSMLNVPFSFCTHVLRSLEFHNS